MQPDDIRDGMSVRITGGRHILDRSWAGTVGTVWATFDRGRVEDWCYVQVPDDGTVIIGFAPDELEADS